MSRHYRSRLSCPDDPPPITAKEGGYVLAVVIVALALISSIVTALMISSRARVQETTNLIAREEVRVLADGFADFLAHDLVEPSHPAARRIGLALDGREARCRVGTDVVDIRMVSTAGLIDLNFAPVSLLALAFQSLNISPAQASSLAAAIVDFRDSDDEKTEGGAERDQYLGAGLKFGPKNAPFESIAELEQVYGVSREMFLAVRPYVTVNSRSSFIDLDLAPVELTMALRSTGEDRLLSSVSAHSAAAAKIIRLMIGIERDHLRFVRDATVEIDKTARGLKFLDWSSVIETSRQNERSVGALGRCF
ncbi:MAG: type II secretion system protein GspK [Hyphomicrobiaceae bacterium]